MAVSESRGQPLPSPRQDVVVAFCGPRHHDNFVFGLNRGRRLPEPPEDEEQEIAATRLPLGKFHQVSWATMRDREDTKLLSDSTVTTMAWGLWFPSNNTSPSRKRSSVTSLHPETLASP